VSTEDLARTGMPFAIAAKVTTRIGGSPAPRAADAEKKRVQMPYYRDLEG